MQSRALYVASPPIDLFGANSHLVQNRLKIDVTPIIAYTGYTPWWERTTVAQSL